MYPQVSLLQRCFSWRLWTLKKGAVLGGSISHLLLFIYFFLRCLSLLKETSLQSCRRHLPMCDRQAYLTEGGEEVSGVTMTLGIKGHSAAFPSGSLNPTVVLSIWMRMLGAQRRECGWGYWHWRGSLCTEEQWTLESSATQILIKTSKKGYKMIDKP